jgi:CBS domain-containing protein
MKTTVHFVHPETLILDAMRMLAEHQISGMPVVDQTFTLKGILTEKDVLKILARESFHYHDTVELFMTKEVVAFTENDSALTVCEFFQRNPIRRVPIVRDGKLVGVVSRREIISLILEIMTSMDAYRFS